MDRERTQQVIPVRRAIPHPRYNDKTLANDIMLLQVGHVAALTPGHFLPGVLHPPYLILDPAGLETAGESWGCHLKQGGEEGNPMTVLQSLWAISR